MYTYFTSTYMCNVYTCTLNVCTLYRYSLQVLQALCTCLYSNTNYKVSVSHLNALTSCTHSNIIFVRGNCWESACTGLQYRAGNALLCMCVHVPTIDGNLFVHIQVQVHEFAALRLNSHPMRRMQFGHLCMYMYRSLHLIF